MIVESTATSSVVKSESMSIHQMCGEVIQELRGIPEGNSDGLPQRETLKKNLIPAKSDTQHRGIHQGSSLRPAVLFVATASTQTLL